MWWIALNSCKIVTGNDCLHFLTDATDVHCTTVSIVLFAFCFLLDSSNALIKRSAGPITRCVCDYVNFLNQILLNCSPIWIERVCHLSKAVHLNTTFSYEGAFTLSESKCENIICLLFLPLPSTNDRFRNLRSFLGRYRFFGLFRPVFLIPIVSYCMRHAKS